MKHISSLMAALAVVILLLSVNGATAQSTSPVEQSNSEAQTAVGSAFTYQGQLKYSGGIINGNCDMAFRLFDSANGSNQIGNAITTTVTVDRSLFTVSLDFGNGVFSGQKRFLQTAVKCGGDTGFTTLSPLQELTAAPYALYSLNNVPLSGGTMTGDLTAPNLIANNNVSQARTGNGTVKAAVYALCNNPVSTMRRYFNNVNGATITITNGASLGICTIDFGFQVDDRYIVATATHPTTQLGVTVFTISGNTAQFFVWHAAANGAAAGGDIYVIVY